MYEIIETTTAAGRSFSVRNESTGKIVRTHRFYDDALAHLRRLENARIRRLRDSNVAALA